MAQIPINPTDNDRLKTRKVQAMLNDLGVLPTKHDERPSFLRSRRSAAVLIDRALDGLALSPSAEKHCCKNSEDFVSAINEKFATSFAAGDFTQAGLIDTIRGVYNLNGASVSLADMIDCSSPGPLFDPATDIDAGGIKMETIDENTGSSGKDLKFTGALLTRCLQGFTVVLEVLSGERDCNIDVYSQKSDGSIWSDAGVKFNFVNGTYNQYLYATPDGSTFIDETNPPASVQAVNPSTIVKIGLTLTETHMAISIAGSPARTLSSGGLDPSIESIEFSTGGGLGDTTGRLRKFDIYEVQTDEQLAVLTAA